MNAEDQLMVAKGWWGGENKSDYLICMGYCSMKMKTL